jgi:hypothetical protein
MKTNSLLPALLALTIHAMVNGQTQETSAPGPASADFTGNSVSKQAMKSESALLKTQIGSLEAQADYFMSVAKSLRDSAKTRKPFETKVMVQEALEWSRQAVSIQLEIALLNVSVNTQEFQRVGIVLNDLMNLSIKDLDVLDHAQTLILEAEHAWKISQQLKEEALAEETTGAQAGQMANALEKQSQALAAQSKAVKILESFAGNDRSCAYSVR